MYTVIAPPSQVTLCMSLVAGPIEVLLRRLPEPDCHFCIAINRGQSCLVMCFSEVIENGVAAALCGIRFGSLLLFIPDCSIRAL